MNANISIILNTLKNIMVGFFIGKRKEISDDIKEKIVELLSLGKRQCDIAYALNISKQRVRYHVKRMKEGFIFSQKSNCGRKELLTSEMKEYLVKKVNEDRFLSGPKLAELIGMKYNINVHPNTVKRSLKKMGFRARSPRKVPLITKINKVKRVELAKKFLLRPKTFWNNVIWSDETKINLVRSDGKFYVWRMAGEEFSEGCTVKTVKHGGGIVMFWGCMSANGVGNLVVIDGIMTGGKYVQILQENLFESAKKMGLESDFIFQQDNDPKHTSKIAVDFFKNNDIKLLEWPSQSPDLNVIEHLWSELKRRYGNYKAKSKSELIHKIQQIWIELGREYPNKLVSSIYSRCNAIIGAKGGSTKY
jgi:transposase